MDPELHGGVLIYTPAQVPDLEKAVAGFRGPRLQRVAEDLLGDLLANGIALAWGDGVKRDAPLWVPSASRHDDLRMFPSVISACDPYALEFDSIRYSFQMLGA